MIFACGESLIDMLPRRSDAGEAAFAPVPGGALFNTAIALGRLGEEAGFVSGISTDMFGEVLMDALAASKVDASAARRSDRPTTLAFVQLVDGHATYAFYDENTAGSGLQAGDLQAPADGVDAAHFGGICLVPESSGGAYEALMADLAGRATISFDPNIRTSFVLDEAAYRARLERMAAMADIIKVSDEDLDWLAQGSSPEALVAQWLEEGRALVCITRGGDGADLHHASGQLTVPAQKAQVVDTIGAGDTFNAGLLAGLRRAGVLERDALRKASPDQLRSAAELAVRVAGVTVSRAGANPPWQSELDAAV